MKQIEEHMNVITKDGELIGEVESISEIGIRLLKDPSSDDCERAIPLVLVAQVDSQVRLSLNLADLRVELSERPAEEANAHLPMG